MPHKLKQIFEMINYVFMIVFALEAIFKIIAMKGKYFKDNWNIFDFTVVVMTAAALGIG